MRTPPAHSRGLLDRLSGGTWTATESPEPWTRHRHRPVADLFGVWCTFDGCVAVGSLRDAATGHRALNTIDGSGSVTAAEGPQPAERPAAQFRRQLRIGVMSVAEPMRCGRVLVGTASTNNIALLIRRRAVCGATPSPRPLRRRDGRQRRFTPGGAVSCPVGGSCQAAGGCLVLVNSLVCSRRTRRPRGTGPTPVTEESSPMAARCSTARPAASS